MLWVLAGLATVYVLICIGMVFMEPKLLYHPPDLDRRALHQEAVAFGATELTVTTEDGLPLYAWRYGSGERLILIFSGNGATVGACALALRRAGAHEVGVLAVARAGDRPSTLTPR